MIYCQRPRRLGTGRTDAAYNVGTPMPTSFVLHYLFCAVIILCMYTAQYLYAVTINPAAVTIATD